MISKWRLSVVVVGGLLIILLGVFVSGRLWLGIPPRLPVVAIEVKDQKVIVSSGIQPPENHGGINRAIKDSGMPLKAIALLNIGSKQMLLVDAEHYGFVDVDGRKPSVLVLPIEPGPRLHNYKLTAPPTNSLTVQLSGIATNTSKQSLIR